MPSPLTSPTVLNVGDEVPPKLVNTRVGGQVLGTLALQEVDSDSIHTSRADSLNLIPTGTGSNGTSVFATARWVVAKTTHPKCNRVDRPECSHGFRLLLGTRDEGFTRRVGPSDAANSYARVVPSRRRL
jgi:hypothetical protein